ncbi:MAG: hypothetical protein Q8P67_01490 [archaeon]|nr:hypothetical protein [archaeon]
MSLLKAIAAQACTADLAAKNIAGDTDVFGSESRAVVTQCRASGLCTNECQAAITTFVEDVKDAYSDIFLPLPSDVKDAANDVSDICSTPFTGFPFRIRTVFNNINCASVQAASFDYLFRLAQLFGLSPANLIIVDCSDIETTRATSASLTLGSSAEPDNVKASDCESVSLSCSEISTDQGGNSSPASAIFVNGLLVVAGAAFLMF